MDVSEWTILRDEQGNISAARVLLFVWTLVIIYLLLFRIDLLNNAVLAFLSGIYLALVTWAAGARIAQHLAPQLGGIISAVGQAKAVSISTDVKEITETLKGTK